MTRRVAGVALAWTALVGCGAAAPERAPAPRPPPPAALDAVLGPARYVVHPPSGWVERAEGGLERAVVNGRRVALRGIDIAAVGPAEPEVDGGAVAPAWAAGAPRYVFWKGKDVYAADAFDGALRKLATLPGDVGRAFDWLDGVGLATTAGVFVVRGPGGAVEPLGAPGAALALAADARRAVALTAFGHALLTLDGGRSWQDASASLGEAQALEVRGDAIAVGLPGRRERYVGPDGRIDDARPPAGAPRGQRPPDIDPRWPEQAPSSPLEAAVSAGLPLPDGGAVVAAGRFLGRVDLATGLATSAAELSPEAQDCAPIRAPDALLAVCAGLGRALVIDVTAAPRVERSFELPAGRGELDRFVGMDLEGLAYLGPCDGPPRPRLEVDGVSGPSSRNPSTQHTPVLCARAGPGAWVEHRLDPEDASDVIAWVPRAGGGAVALVARPGPFLRDEPRVTVRGALRVVRFPRSEPPLDFPEYRYGSPALLARGFSARSDDTLVGWLPSQTQSANVIAVTIDAAGRLLRHAMPPRVSSLHPSGRFALVHTEDGRLFESIDFGRRWLEIEPPPGDPFERPSGCSAVGCRIGQLLRIGWASADLRAAPRPRAPADEERVLGALRDRRSYRRPPAAPPVVRVACEPAGPPQGVRLPESFGFGVTPAPVPRNAGPSRLGTVGTVVLPWNGPQVGATGDVELGWLVPFDFTGRVHRRTIALANAGLGNVAYRPYDTQVGWIIDAGGRVAPIAVGNKDACLAPLLDAAGLTRPAGGCAPQPAVGVELDDRILLLSPRYDGQIVTAVQLGAGKAGGRSGPPAPSAPRELRVQRAPVGAQGAFSFGAGARAGAPVFVAVDHGGDAVLTPADPERGLLGPEERLAPLRALRPGGDPACAAQPDQARVVLPFDTEIGVGAGLPGVVASGTGGVAVIRWSASVACLDAVEIAVRDERHEMDFGYYDPPGTVKKIVARFAGPPPLYPLSPSPALAREAPPEGAPEAPRDPGAPQQATPPAKPGAAGKKHGAAAAPSAGASPKGATGAALVLVTHGQEVRQPLVCRGVAP